MHTVFPRDIVCLRNISINTLHKGDDDDDDDNNNNNKLDKHWSDHVPKSVETSHEGKVTILRNQQVRTIPHNKPVIIIRDNKKGTCVLIDVAAPGNRNVIKKDTEKILKCRDLII